MMVSGLKQLRFKERGKKVDLNCSSFCAFWAVEDVFVDDGNVVALTDVGSSVMETLEERKQGLVLADVEKWIFGAVWRESGAVKLCVYVRCSESVLMERKKLRRLERLLDLSDCWGLRLVLVECRVDGSDRREAEVRWKGKVASVLLDASLEKDVFGWPDIVVGRPDVLSGRGGKRAAEESVECLERSVSGVSGVSGSGWESVSSGYSQWKEKRRQRRDVRIVRKEVELAMARERRIELELELAETEVEAEEGVGGGLGLVGEVCDVRGGGGGLGVGMDMFNMEEFDMACFAEQR